MTLFLKADLTPEEQMQRVIRKYPEADFSSISQFRTRNSLVAGGKISRPSGKKKKEDAAESKAGCLVHSDNRFSGVGIA